MSEGPPEHSRLEQESMAREWCMWTSGNEDKGEERAEDDEMNMCYERIDGWGASGLHPLGYRAKTKSSLDGLHCIRLSRQNQILPDGVPPG